MKTTSSTLTSESVLAAARATREAIDGLEIEMLQRAVDWVLLHPGDQEWLPGVGFVWTDPHGHRHTD